MPSIFTTAVHAGERASRPNFTPVATPIYHSSSYIYDDMKTLSWRRWNWCCPPPPWATFTA